MGDAAGEGGRIIGRVVRSDTRRRRHVVLLAWPRVLRKDAIRALGVREPVLLLIDRPLLLRDVGGADELLAAVELLHLCLAKLHPATDSTRVSESLQTRYSARVRVGPCERSERNLARRNATSRSKDVAEARTRCSRAPACKRKHSMLPPSQGVTLCDGSAQARDARGVRGKARDAASARMRGGSAWCACADGTHVVGWRLIGDHWVVHALGLLHRDRRRGRLR